MEKRGARLFQQEIGTSETGWNIVELEARRQLRQKVNALIRLCNDSTLTTSEMHHHLLLSVAEFGNQLAAQLVGISTLLGFVFTFSFLLNLVLEFFIGHRVSAETEIAGLDIPEMGQLGYPEFVFREEAGTFTEVPAAAVA